MTGADNGAASQAGPSKLDIAAGGRFLRSELPENIQNGLFIEQCTQPAVVQSGSRRIVDTDARNGREDSVEEYFDTKFIFRYQND